FRRKLMAKYPKHLAVLNAVAEKIGWGQPAPQGVYRGLAQQMGYGSYVAAAVEISVTGGNKIKIHRIVGATDCGYAVNPAQIERQVAGSFVYGLSALFTGECTVKDGRIEQQNFDSYDVMRIAQMPKVETILMPSGGFWGGVGEPTIFVAAPAVLNAYFAATGKRIRSIPASISAIGGSLVLGFEIPFGTRATHASVGPREITAWIVIEPDETVIIRVAKSEMGQGSFTALPMLVAEELECDWSKVRAEFAPPHENRKRNRVWGNMSTGASRSISASQNDLRRAGATARAMLIAAAAARWNVPMTECTAAQGVISHGPSGRSVTFGAIAAAAADMNAPTQVA